MSSVTSLKLLGNFIYLEPIYCFLYAYFISSPFETRTYLFNKIRNACLFFINLDLSPEVETNITSVMDLL